MTAHGGLALRWSIWGRAFALACRGLQLCPCTGLVTGMACEIAAEVGADKTNHTCGLALLNECRVYTAAAHCSMQPAQQLCCAHQHCNEEAVFDFAT